MLAATAVVVRIGGQEGEKRIDLFLYLERERGRERLIYYKELYHVIVKIPLDNITLAVIWRTD